jgi:type IV pilus assembly protein PilW
MLSRQRQRGLSLVELMVGVTVGLFVVAGATMLMGSQLGDNRRLVLETQVQQDLRAAADIVVRDLRRAGHWSQAHQGLVAAGAASAASNPYGALGDDGNPGPAQEITFSYARTLAENGVVDSSEQGGFRLQAQTLQMLLGGNWQALTDVNTLQVTQFTVNVNRRSLALPCALPCPAGSSTCPPQQVLREVTVAIAGRAAHDASVQRSVRSHAKLRNDQVTGACPA